MGRCKNEGRKRTEIVIFHQGKKSPYDDQITKKLRQHSSVG